MGMYTQIRGFLCCDSVGAEYDKFEMFENTINALLKEFKESNPDNHWCNELLTLAPGSNGSKWIFIGSEGKDYGGEREKFLRYLVDYFPCEGRIEFQYEEKSPGDTERVWLITEEEFLEREYTIHTKGYGFLI